jgi:hypothetical protein
LKAGGFARTNDGAESGGTFLVGYRGVVYEVNSDYQVGIPAHAFAAVGCGSQIALGSLFTTIGRGFSVSTRIDLALRAAECFSAGVRAPFVFIS